jgi:hypothetical protein
MPPLARYPDQQRRAAAEQNQGGMRTRSQTQSAKKRTPSQLRGNRQKTTRAGEDDEWTEFSDEQLTEEESEELAEETDEDEEPAEDGAEGDDEQSAGNNNGNGTAYHSSTHGQAYLRWAWWLFWIFIFWQSLTEVCRRTGSSCSACVSLPVSNSQCLVTVVYRRGAICFDPDQSLTRDQEGDGPEYVCVGCSSLLLYLAVLFLRQLTA